jgi:aryl-alcohol dehydrogenase-like predicted oxidoreductase
MTLVRGAIHGRPYTGRIPPRGSRTTDRKGGAEAIEAFLADDVLTRIQRLKPLAADADLTMAQIALAWVLGTEGVSAAVIGASQPVQVFENANGSGIKLDRDLRTQIDEILDPVVWRDPELTISPARRG